MDDNDMKHTIIGRTRERKADAFTGVHGASSSSSSVALLPLTRSLSLDDGDASDDKRMTSMPAEHGITIELKAFDDTKHDDPDDDMDNNNDDKVVSPMSPRRVRAGIYDRVAAERTAILMAFNDKAGRDSAVV